MDGLLVIPAPLGSKIEFSMKWEQTKISLCSRESSLLEKLAAVSGEMCVCVRSSLSLLICVGRMRTLCDAGYSSTSYTSYTPAYIHTCLAGAHISLQIGLILCSRCQQTAISNTHTSIYFVNFYFSRLALCLN